MSRDCRKHISTEIKLIKFQLGHNQQVHLPACKMSKDNIKIISESGLFFVNNVVNVRAAETYEISNFAGI